MSNKFKVDDIVTVDGGDKLYVIKDVTYYDGCSVETIEGKHYKDRYVKENRLCHVELPLQKLRQIIRDKDYETYCINNCFAKLLYNRADRLKNLRASKGAKR